MNYSREDEKSPTEWKEGLIVKFPKKENLRDCDNYRGITLLCIAIISPNNVLSDECDVLGKAAQCIQGSYNKSVTNQRCVCNKLMLKTI